MLVRFRQGGDRLVQFVYVDVWNAGTIVACNATLSFKPALQPADPTKTLAYLEQFVAKGIKTLVPGATISTLFDFGRERTDVATPRRLPDEYTRSDGTYQNRLGVEARRL